MFGISFTELALVGLVALIIFGPDKLPELASKFGKMLGTFRKTSDKFRQEFYNSVYTPAKDLEKNIQSKLVAVKEEVEEKITEKKNVIISEKDKLLDSKSEATKNE